MENWKMMVAVFAGSIFLVVLMAIGLSKISSNGTGTIKVTTEELISGARWVKTTGEPKVTVVGFSDIQCPACKAAEPIATELRKTDGVRFVYRHFPLTTIHKNAWKGARALEAARLMDKGWEMVALMFEKQEEWANEGNPDELFIGYAKSLSLDENEFGKKMMSDETDKAVGEDSSLGSRLQLSGTPTFFVNGEQVGSPYILDKVKSLLSN
ncbi:hypothetical protein A3A84_03085 [Candidatus Collierbacteria bacterium RIFCSPLOWO2_01_FULL_50_23]|uniref:Thioredoxin domain-containing protein n=2 Tax=Candidatus Collieribacteriota TaxID=1752725 RepID=A0A1F5EWQ0_9BACT|nr:MAG: hypothetical protein A2703_03960 [Candidatus Collierbacteria bacterium RIFCSPHIGHO2_01_FULL_50_25]OGD71858.1 MAG: hypothetical protein A3D09_01610 [Candidatus Collierbacteria bacterium RIFCSPHIGHO2_02_FULL_49_10]OGD74443.1 MAG: hypothetical protein A3A84_03085 [Candidatus Collierbacteria bacterium RIFCSPLOWO2_01_FULL_50_23]